MATQFIIEIMIPILVHLLSCIMIIHGLSECDYHPTQSVPVAIYGHQTVYHSPSHAVYVLGGITTAAVRVNTIYKLLLNENTWNLLDVSTPTTEFFSAANNIFLINDTVYFIGIYDTSFISGIIYSFNIETEEWSNNTRMTHVPHPAVYGCLTGNSTHLFMVGGSNGGSYIDYLQIYDIKMNEWTVEQITISPIAVNGWNRQYCTMVNDELYVFGGWVGNTGYFDGIYSYNDTQKWSYIGSLPAAQNEGSVVYRYGSIYILGGVPETDVIYEFDINSESIQNQTYRLKEPLYDISGATQIINGKLYVFGGHNGVNAVSDIQICDIFATPTNAPSTFAEATNAPATSAQPTNHPSTSAEPTNAPSTSPEPTTASPITSAPSSAPTSDDADCDNDDNLERDDCDETDDEPDHECSILVILSFNVCYVDCYKDKRSKLWNDIKQCLCKNIFVETSFDDNKKKCYIEKYHYGDLVDVYNVYNETNQNNCTLQQSFEFSTAIYSADCDYLRSVYEWSLEQGGNLLNALRDCNLLYSENVDIYNPSGFVGITSGSIYITLRDQNGDIVDVVGKGVVHSVYIQITVICLIVTLLQI